MATENNSNNQPETTTGNVSVAMIPNAGQSRTITPEPGQGVQLPFDMADQTVLVTGDDLQVQFANGAVLVFEDFAATDSQGNTPMFVMLDGSVVPGNVLLTVLNGEPVETAAGEAGGGESGGAGEYDDDLGNILTGIDKLGTQDPDAFPVAAAAVPEEEQPPIEIIDEPQNQPPEAIDDFAETGEDNSITFGVLPNDNDPDGDPIDVISFTPLEPGQGTLTFNEETNQFTFDPAGDFEHLDNGETEEVTFTYTISDPEGATDTATVTIVVEGTNDGPVATANTASVTEDGPLTDSGNMIDDNDGFGVDSDVDGDNLTVASIDGDTTGTVAGTYGSLAWGTDGSYTYTLNNANGSVQALDDGETLTDTFTYTVTDGDLTDTALVTVTINGTNDGPVATANTASVTEDGPLTDSGNMIDDNDGFGVDSDVDGDNLTVASIDGDTTGTVAGTYGSLAWGTDGSYTYTLNNANGSVQALDDGETLTDTFTYTVTDGDLTDTALVTVTINGTSDGPVATANTASVTEDGPLTDSGNMIDDNDGFGVDSDVDGDNLTVASIDGDTTGTVAGTYGSLAWGTDGSYTYTLNNANGSVQALDDGETLTDTFTYTVTDGDLTDTALVTVTINGTNDGPVATANTASVTEDGPLTDSGNMIDDNDGFGVDSDVDGDNLTVASIDGDTTGTVAGTYGSLAWGTDGSYTYTLNNANGSVQALDDGETLTDTFTYTVTDGDLTDTALVTVTINGTSDGPVATANTASVTEDGPLTDSGNMIDDNDGFGVDSDVDGDNLTVASIDGDTTGTVAGTYGSLAWGTDGSYTYTLNNANGSVQALDDGETLTDTFTYTVTDGDLTDTALVTVTINGTSDGPVATANTASVTEDGPLTDSGNMIDDNDGFGVDSDVDGDNLTVASIDGDTTGTVAGTYGSLAWGTDGSYTYTLNNANGSVQALDDGETLTDTFTYTVTDGDLTDTALVTVTINGTNDGPVATANTASVTEDGPLTDSGNMIDDNDGFGVDSDVDGDNLTVASIDGDTTGTVAGTYGSLAWGTDGSYTYTLNNANGSVQALDDGETLTDTFTYTVTDGDLTDTALVTVTINGTSDGPVATANTASVTEDGPLTDSGNMIDDNDGFGVDSDVDGDNLTVASIDGDTTGTVAGTYGSLAWGTDGSYTYTLNNANGSVQALDDGETLTDTFTYTVTDGDLTDTALVTVTINGTNDAPTINIAGDGHTVYESGLPTGSDAVADTEVASGSFTIADTDGLDDINTLSIGSTTFTIGIGPGEFANLSAMVGQTADVGFGTVELTGYSSGTFTYTYTLDETVDNDSQTNATDIDYDETFAVTVSDGTISVSSTVTVTIIDDVPIDIGPEAAVLLNQPSQSFTGILDFDGQIEDNVGADQPGSVRFPASLESITDTGITSGGLDIFYNVSGDGQTLTGYTSAGNVFTITLNPDSTGTDQYTLNMIGTLDGGATLIDFNDGNYDFVGGNASWAGFNTAADDGSQDILLTPITGGDSAGTVNTNNNEGGINSNSVGSGEAMRVDFVTDLRGNPVNGGDFSTDNTQEFDSHYTQNSASALFTATKGSTVRIKAFDDDDSGILKTVGDGDKDNITAVAIVYNNEETLVSFDDIGTTPTDFIVGGHTFNITFDGTEAVVASVVDNTVISTYTGDGYNSIEYHWENHAEFDGTFKIGNFGTTTIEVGEPVDFTVPVELVDADGDVADGTIDVVLMPESTQDFSASATGVDETSTQTQPHIIGSDHDDTLTGDAQDNALFGGEGNDLLVGGEGDDILVGGPGSDNFIYSALNNEGQDTLTDFNIDEDTLSFYDVLDDGDGVLSDAELAAFTDDITITIDGGNVSLADANGTTLNLEDANLGATPLADFNGSLTDFLNSHPDAINIDINPDTFAS